MLCTEPGVLPEVSAEISCQRLSIAPRKQSQQYQSSEGRDFSDREDILDEGPNLHAEDVDHGKHNDHNDSNQVLRIQADVHIASTMGPTLMGGTFQKCRIQAAEEIEGKKTPRNLPKATPTAAIVPVWMTRNKVQP